MKYLIALTGLFLASLTWAADFDMDGSGRTTILSETLEMVSTDDENVFYFTNNVRAQGNNLSMTADQVVVRAVRLPEENDDDDTLGSIGTIKTIVATGNVVIDQEGRKAKSGKAEFFPTEGKMVLTENPTVIDNKAIVSGWRITLIQGERRVMVEQDPNGTQRPSVNLSQMPDLGFDEEPEPAAQQPQEPIEELAPSGLPSTSLSTESTL